MSASARKAGLDPDIVQGDAGEPGAYALFSVGASRFDGRPRPLGSRRLFTFNR